MCSFKTLLRLLIINLIKVHIRNTYKLSAHDECKWIMINDSNESDIALVCQLQSINSELGYTNFSTIDPQHTTRLRIQCSNLLFFQSSLNSGTFQTLTQLKEISIDYCKIRYISDDVFKNLNQLKNLTIRTRNTNWPMMILELAPKTFNSLHLLEKLDLSNNNIRLLPNQLLHSLRSLKILNVTKNRIQDIHNFQFDKCCSNLQLLDLSNNLIENISANSFSNLSNLKKLYLQKNHLKLLHEKSFNGLNSLEILNLSDNRLIHLPSDLFIDQKSTIKELYLRNNNVTILDARIFDNLNDLLVLDVSKNNLSSNYVNSGTLIGLKKLIVLDLSKNRLTKLDKTIFQDLNSLQILRLNDNQFESLIDNLFLHQHNLHTLTISNNRLNHINALTFNGLRRLSLLSIDNNELRTIEENSLKNCSHLHDLHLNGNQLDDIPNIFRNVPFLRTLDLGENFLQHLSNKSFNHLKYLYGLRLSHNNIESISKEVFNKMTSLKVLNLSKNQIKFIEIGSLHFNRHLQAIRLDGNRLTNFRNLFENLDNLVWLNISDNQLTSFDYSNIPINLQWLDIHANQISNLKNDLSFGGFLLSTFDVSFNHLTELSSNSLPDSIRVLYLNNNRITTIEANTFLNKVNLTKVDLMNNQLTQIDRNAFRIKPVPIYKDLPLLFIANNPLKCHCTMDWLQNTNYNNDNQFRTQPKFVDIDQVQCQLEFQRYQSYDKGSLSQNDLVCKYESYCPLNCNCCKLKNCNCKIVCPNNCMCYHDQLWSENIIDCSNSKLNENFNFESDFNFNLNQHLPTLNVSFASLPINATEIYLDGNNYPILKSYQFFNRFNLRVLYLNNSKIEKISNRTFHTLNQLKLLDLHDNRIRILRGFEFHSLNALEFLNLENNNIEWIDNDTFQSLSNLKYLNLIQNQLKSFPIWNLILPNNVYNLQIHSNSWLCNCEFLYNFQNWLEENLHLIENVPNLKCYEKNAIKIVSYVNQNCEQKFNKSTLNEIQSEHLSKHTTKILISQTTDYITWLLIIFVSLIFVTFGTLFVFIYRFEIKALLYDFFNLKMCIHFNRDIKLFDSFITYSCKDEQFVYEQLVKELEENGKRNYKLCLQHRDLTNTFMAQTILQAVEASRTTIMILSDNFLKSEWSHFELKSAHNQILRDRKKCLIVILLGTVAQRKDLDPDIKLYLKTNICLQWGDKWFWQKLRFSLSNAPVSRTSSTSHRKTYFTQPHSHANNMNSNLQPSTTSPSLLYHHHYYHHYHPYSYLNSQTHPHLRNHTSNNQTPNSPITVAIHI